MLLFLIFAAAPLQHHLQTLASVYPELKMTRDDLLETLQVNCLTPLHSASLNATHDGVLLPVRNVYSQNLSYAIVDAEDYPELSQYKWKLLTSGYAVTSTMRGKYMYLHRMVAGCVSRHLNKNKLDNRKVNLREALPRGAQKQGSHPLSASSVSDPSTS